MRWHESFGLWDPTENAVCLASSQHFFGWSISYWIQINFIHSNFITRKSMEAQHNNVRLQFTWVFLRCGYFHTRFTIHKTNYTQNEHDWTNKWFWHFFFFLSLNDKWNVATVKPPRILSHGGLDVSYLYRQNVNSIALKYHVSSPLN